MAQIACGNPEISSNSDIFSSSISACEGKFKYLGSRILIIAFESV